MLTLSQAIRLGAMLHPQTFGQMEMCDDATTIVATCALGAARVALGDAAYQRVLDCDSTITCCPCLDCQRRAREPEPFHLLITHLNDFHRWTREAIADWIATLEAHETPQDAAPELVRA